jgi:uncharacterized membrane protein YfcA
MFAFLSSWATSILISALSGWLYAFYLGLHGADALWIVGAVVAPSSLVSFCFIVLIGAPAYLYFQRADYTSLGSYLAGGLIISLVGAMLAIFKQLDFSERLESNEFYIALIDIALSGPFAAGVFWAIRRPQQAM